MKSHKKDEGKFSFRRYIGIALLVMIIFIVINKFGFTRDTEVAKTEIVETEVVRTKVAETEVVKTGGGGLNDIALEYYFEKYPEQAKSKDIEVMIQNFGCHQEIYIYKEGNEVMKMIYEYGQLHELK